MRRVFRDGSRGMDGRMRVMWSGGLSTSSPSSRGAQVRDLLDRPALAAVLLIAAFAIPVLFVALVPHPLEQPFGVDFQLYREVTNRWLGGGSFYESYQLAGPYEIRAGDVLYPPVSLWLFVPFAAGAGAIAALAAVVSAAWWALPLGATAASV